MIILLSIKSFGLKERLQLFFIDRKRGNTILAVMLERVWKMLNGRFEISANRIKFLNLENNKNINKQIFSRRNK